MATWAIGDVQGCDEALRCLLKKIRFNDECDELWFAGDLVNRGPRSLKALKRIYKLRDNCRVVLGNHDLHLLAVGRGMREIGRKDTFIDVFASKKCERLLDWLQQQPLMHIDERKRFVMVHAGIAPMWSIKKAGKYAAEVQAVLRSEQAKEFFAAMYGDVPERWDERLEGAQRWRLITNYFTRMRFCTEDGRLDLADKSSIRSSRPGYKPWFEYLTNKLDGYEIVFGHWAALQGNTDTYDIHALDTGCVWGGKLMAMNLNSRELISCNCKN